MKMSEIRAITKLFQVKNGMIPYEEMVYRAEAELGIRLDMVYQELEMDDPYVDTHEDPGSHPEAVQLHSHSFYEILYIYRGNLQYLVGTERYRLQHGDMVLIPPGVSHRPMFSEAGQQIYHRYVLWLSPDFVSHISPCFAREDFRCPSILRTAGTRWSGIGDRMKQGIRETERRKPGWQAMVYGNTMQVMTMLYRAVKDSKGLQLASETPALLDRILAYLEDNFHQHITLEQTARQFYVSASTVSTTFRREMGVSFHRCLTQRRLIAAKNLILGGAGLETVAELVGFSDYSAFYRAFKSEYGVSPKQFRIQSLRQAE